MVVFARAVEGAKGVGKTATCARHARQVLALDRREVTEPLRADPDLILTTDRPVRIDEWQLLPTLWDLVRRQVDRDPALGQFLLTGSATGTVGVPVHSGAGRIVRLHLHPMALCERALQDPTVSLASLAAGERQAIRGSSTLSLADYVQEIVRSGLPGVRALPERHRGAQLDSYLSTSLDHDIADLGASVRRPAALRAWLTAYGAATATTTSYNAILDAATAGETDKPARQTATAYRELLQRLSLLDAVPAWQPTLSPLRRLAHAPKHHLVDPALAARLVGATPDSLLRGTGAAVRVGDGTLLGARFESLAALSMRSICAVLDLRVSHFRTQNGDREVDFTFGTAADDPPYQQVYYTDTYLVPVDVAILVGLAVVGLTGAGLRVLRRRPR